MKKKQSVESKKVFDGIVEFTEAELCGMRDMFSSTGWESFSKLLKAASFDQVDLMFSHLEALSLAEYTKLHAFVRAVQVIRMYPEPINALIEEFEKEKQEQKTN